MGNKLIPQLIVALDNIEPSTAREIVPLLKNAGVSWFKVGLELYTRSGPEIVKTLKKSGVKIFLDLKLHDIPNTVARATQAAADLGVDFLTLHALGGSEMIKAATKAIEKTQTKLLAVTVLTGHSGQYPAFLKEMLAVKPASENVSRATFAENLMMDAKKAGAHGIVCSVPDLLHSNIKRLAGEDFFIVTPGIRQNQDRHDDQKSIATVTDAIRAGSTHIVMGRPILQPADKTIKEAVEEILNILRVH